MKYILKVKNSVEILLTIILPILIFISPVILVAITGNKMFYWGFSFSWVISIAIAISGLFMVYGKFEEIEVDSMDCNCCSGCISTIEDCEICEYNS